MSESTNVKILPPGQDKPATTVLEALKYGREILAAEGRWCEGSWYEIEDPDVDPDTPFCDSWKVCAEGAVALAIYGAQRHKHDREWNVLNDLGPKDAELWDYIPTDDELALYELTKEALVDAGKELFKEYDGGYVLDFTRANQINDEIIKSRADVLEWFDKAIEGEQTNA